MIPPIQSLWIGDRLSRMEQLSIRSFLRHGHAFHLYAFAPPEGAPPGAEVRDASEILPQSRVFRYAENGSYAGFANFFRYKLLLERGGWWADLDMICQRPFVFSAEHVIATETLDGKPAIANCVLKAPSGSPLMGRLWDRCQQFDVTKLKWGESGPHLVSAVVEELSLNGFAQPPEIFCPIAPPDWESVLNPWARHTPGPRTHAIHLWHELWRRAGRDTDAAYPRWCLYERLQQEYGMPRTGNLWNESLESLRMLLGENTSTVLNRRSDEKAAR